MEQMHKRMSNDSDGRMGYGMGRGGMGMMNMMGGGMMGRGGMGMMNMMGPGGMGMMGSGMSPMMMNMFGLDKKQRSQIRDLMRAQRNTRCNMMNNMMDIQDELAEQYDKDKPDAKAIGKTYAKLYDQKRKMIEQSIETRNKIRDVLNKEQKQRFDQMHRGGGMMGPGGGMGMMNMMGGGMGSGGMGMMNMMQ